MLSTNYKRQIQELNVDFNSMNVETLFQKYKDIGFIYESKRKMLAPFMASIKLNWEKLLASNNELLWIFSSQNQTTSNFASVCAWRHSNTGMLAQHLVSDGNPFLSLRLMLAAQIKAIHSRSFGPIESSQNWFRKENRYAYRVFASMVKKLGQEHAALNVFDLVKLPKTKFKQAPQNRFKIEDINKPDQRLIDFANQSYSRAFTRAEELDSLDIRGTKISKEYAKCGLIKSKKIITITDSTSSEILACAIANKAPIGLNFSFLENRCYYLMKDNLDIQSKIMVLEQLNNSIQEFYQSSEIDYIPIVSSESISKILQNLGASYIRTYMQSIWLRNGFTAWYDHIQSFLDRIEKRKINVTAA